MEKMMLTKLPVAARVNKDNLMKRITVGDVIEQRVLETLQSGPVEIPHPVQLTHLQFRRFAGCPLCNLHRSLDVSEAGGKTIIHQTSSALRRETNFVR
ncbi:MAG: hypothetical protein HY080_08430 [Gammaproteobacteria bacterium]|nr:hypothetical protein [Gammaproteobacteria bacterium]